MAALPAKGVYVNSVANFPGHKKQPLVGLLVYFARLMRALGRQTQSVWTDAIGAKLAKQATF